MINTRPTIINHQQKGTKWSKPDKKVSIYKKRTEERVRMWGKKWKGWDKERSAAIQNKLTVHPAALEYHLRSPEIEGFFPERSLSTARKEKVKKQYTFSEGKNIGFLFICLPFNLFSFKTTQWSSVSVGNSWEKGDNIWQCPLPQNG